MARPHIEETGNRYGRLTVIGWLGERKWLCECDCGEIREILGANLRAGKQKSCGCLRTERIRGLSGRPLIDETGKRYGRVVVLKRVPEITREGTWLCQCDCERLTQIAGSKLRSGRMISCGCYRREQAIQRLVELNREGEAHPKWKGENVSYGGLHVWVRKHKPQTGSCELCGKEGYTEYANLSPNHSHSRDLADWAELCKPCHMRLDGHPWIRSKA